MKRILFLAFIALAASALVTGCSSNLDTNPAAPGADQNDVAETWDGDRAGSFFSHINIVYEPFSCTATVSWTTALETDDNYLHYGNSAASLIYTAQAPDGGTNHSVVIDVSNLNRVWYMQLEGEPFENMPPITSDVMYKKRPYCITE